MPTKITIVLAAIVPLAFAGALQAQTQGDAAADGAAPMIGLPAACIFGETAAAADMGWA